VRLYCLNVIHLLKIFTKFFPYENHSYSYDTIPYFWLIWRKKSTISIKMNARNKIRTLKPDSVWKTEWNYVCFGKKMSKILCDRSTGKILRKRSKGSSGAFLTKKHFFSKHTSFHSVFQTESGFNAQILFRAFIFIEIVDFFVPN
jgi:hypothetical protein